jgi:hypothetical protein
MPQIKKGLAASFPPGLTLPPCTESDFMLQVLIANYYCSNWREITAVAVFSDADQLAINAGADIVFI